MNDLSVGAVPAPRSENIRAAGEWFVVSGPPTTLVCPKGERAHEVLVSDVLTAVDEATREAV